MKKYILFLIGTMAWMALLACSAEEPVVETEPHVVIMGSSVFEESNVSEMPAIPEALVLPETTAALDALFEGLTVSGEITNDMLEEVKVEKREWLLDYLMTGFLAGELEQCENRDGSVAYLKFRTWQSMLLEEAIMLEAETPQIYWQKWCRHVEDYYNSDLLYLLGDDSVSFHYVDLWLGAGAEPTLEEETALSEPITELQLGEEIFGYENDGFYGFQVKHAYLQDEMALDLDDCGQEERVQLLCVVDEYNQESFAVRIIKADQVFDTCSPVRFASSLWVNDMDCDGTYEIFLTGDTGSDDYVIYGWNLTGTGLISLSNHEDPYLQERGYLMSGEIIGAEDHTMTIRDYKHVLSSWYFVGEFTYSQADGLYLVTAWETDLDLISHVVVVKTDLPVMMDGEKTVLPEDTMLAVVGYDGENNVFVKTLDGETAVILVEAAGEIVDGEYAYWTIDDRSENVYFDKLCYAG